MALRIRPRAFPADGYTHRDREKKRGKKSRKMIFFSLVKPKEGRNGTENGHANNRLYIKIRCGPRRVM